MHLNLTLILIFISTIYFAGCSPLPQGDQSVLVIAVSNFRGDDLNCGSSRDSFTPQLDEICSESVRFTHAYTPSVLSNPALASLLTGLYPAQHGVHRNDAGRYADDVYPLAHFAHEEGLESIFVSGGVPVLRKSAISRGFDYFDDSVRSGGGFYRPADEVVKRFLSQLIVRSPGNSFLGVVHFADLEFPEILSLKGSQNEKREGRETGKLQEIDDALGRLHSEFQKWRIWDRTTVVVVGLQGAERSEHNGLSKGINLYDEAVRVPLLIKPSRKPSDRPPSWKVDAAVSLVDVGATLFKILGSKEYPKNNLPFHDLSETLKGRGVEPKEEPIFSESDLPAWRHWGPRLVSMRLGEWNYLLIPEAKLFNTYTDRNEIHSLSPGESPLFSQLQKTWQEFKATMQAPVEQGKYFLPVSISEKLRVAKVIFSRDTLSSEKQRELDVLQLRRPEDWQIVQWHAQLLLDNQDWPAMRRFLKSIRPTTSIAKAEFTFWSDFLSIKSKPDTTENLMKLNSDCLYLAIALKRFSISELDLFQAKHQCSESEITFWIKSFVASKLKRSREASSYLETARTISDKRIEQQEFSKQFWIDGATWDYPDTLPEGPSKFDFFMALVSNQDFLNYVKRK